MSVTFTTFVKAETPKATSLPVPPEAVAALGKEKKPRVVVTVNGEYTFRGTVMVYGGQTGLPFHAEDREAAGVKAGDQVEITLALDLEPRTVEVPDVLAAALGEVEGLREKFDGLSYSKRKEFVRQVTDAKTEETRNKRIAKVVEGVRGE